MPLLKVEELTVDFGSFRALGGLSFSLDAGERLAIVGESRAGKSLCGLAIADLLPEGARRGGKLSFDDAPMPTNEKAMATLRGHRIGMVFQQTEHALNPLRRIGGQLLEAVKLNRETGYSGNEVVRLLNEAGLSRRDGARYPHQLSPPERQRVMIAMALASGPDLLIADEPTSALDALTQKAVFDLIADVCTKRKMALLFISQDLRAAAMLCSRVLVLQNGRLVETGKSETMFTQPRHEHTRGLIAAGKPRARALARSPIGGDLLELRSVTRRFATPRGSWFGHGTINAVDAVSFSIKAVESVALVGAHGAGKTTLARLIVGLDRASEGEMVFDRETYHGSDLPHGLRPDISLVFRDPFTSIDPHLTVGQSIAEPLRLLPQIAPAQRLLRVEEALAAVGLASDARKARPGEFSGLDRQRIAVARALVTRPRLVVLDEPLSALDVSERAEMLGLLTRLRADFSLACLIISPDLDPVRPMADRVLIMSEGKIVEVARPTELFTTPRHAVTEALLKARLPDIG